MTRFGLAINTGRCIGCHTCANACKMQNNVPMGMLWNRVLTEGCDIVDGAVGQYPNVSRAYLPVACQHCENPACLRVCPTGATYKDEKGRVEIAYDKCIGCRTCMAACPYNARWINPETKVADNCDFCLHSKNLAAGELPGCVAHCRFHALSFGDLNDPNSFVSKLLKAKDTVRIRPWLGTEPTLRYIPVVKTGVR